MSAVARVRVGHEHDSAENEARSVAHAVTQPARTTALPPCPTCATAPQACPACGGHTTLRRSASGAATTASAGWASRPAQPLRARDRAYFEGRLGADLGAVRLHTDAVAGRAAAAASAHAMTLGADIAFADGAYRPDSAAGRELLAHELVHTLQGDAGTLRRQEAPAPLAAAPASPLPAGGTLAERERAFQALVRTTAIQRLTSNQLNLDAWSNSVASALPASAIAAFALSQAGSSQLLLDIQDQRDPLFREFMAAQAFGRFRACTGCHLSTQIQATRAERQPSWGWRSPNEQRAADPFGPGYTPPTGTAEGRLNTLFPNPAGSFAARERARQLLEPLGPAGYNVLPGSILASLETRSIDSIRVEVISAIAGRRSDYGELIRKIEAGDVGWEHFGPIIASLLPLADPELRTALQREMDEHANWEKARAVVVGLLSVVALIAAIFPPTSALGIAAVGALNVGLGTYALATAPGMIATGQAYSLGTGGDVFTPDQVASGPGMVLTGFVALLTAPLQIAGGVGQLSRAASGLGTTGTTSALARSGRLAGGVIRRGEYLISIGEDGAMTVTHTGSPDLLIIVRNGEATLYRSMGPGGLRVLASSRVPATATVAAEPLAFPLLSRPGGPPLLPSQTVLIDTTVIDGIRRGLPGVEAQFEAARAAGIRFAVPRPVYTEALRGGNGAAARAVIERLGLPIDEGAGLASRMPFYDQALGQGIRFEGLYSPTARETGDLVIGAHARTADLPFWTLDQRSMTPLGQAGVTLWFP